jgi:hypothetical protein
MARAELRRKRSETPVGLVRSVPTQGGKPTRGSSGKWTTRFLVEAATREAVQNRAASSAIFPDWKCENNSHLYFTVHCHSLLLFFFCVLYCSFFLYFTESACDVRAATLTEGFPCFSSVVKQMPGYNSQRRGTARTSQISFKFFDCYVCSVRCILCTDCV